MAGNTHTHTHTLQKCPVEGSARLTCAEKRVFGESVGGREEGVRAAQKKAKLTSDCNTKGKDNREEQEKRYGSYIKRR